MKAKNFYLIVRGQQPESHAAPYSEVILCTRKHTADWESLGTKNGCTVFVNLAPPYGTWMCVKYKGYDLDTRPVAHYLDLFDGKNTRDLEKDIENYLKQALWWSYDEMPEWIKESGVSLPSDNWTKKQILQDSGTCYLSYSKQQALERQLEKYETPTWLDY